MIALLESAKAGLFRKEHLLPNIIAGLVVGVVALPLAMAFAIASGAKPEQGIYTAIIAGFLVSALGGSRLQIAGPTGAFIVILAGITAKYGIEGLQTATLMAGIMLMAMGFAKLGKIIRFIPDPVIAGFTAGIGVIIWVGQWKDFFGLPAPHGEHFHEKLWHLLQALPHFHPMTTVLAGLSLALLLIIPKIKLFKRIPAPLIAMIVATALQSYFHFDGIATIGSAFGGIPRGLPHFALPDLHLPHIIELTAPAFTIALLGAIESLLSATVADGMAGTRHNPNQELIGQGVANVVAPLFGGFAATGAIARTATNIRNGGTSSLSGIVHALTLLLVILFFAPLAENIPLCALAAILFVVAWNMSDVKHVIRMARRAPRSDVAILFITFGLTVFMDLVVAVNIGVILATLHFLAKMADSVEMRQLTIDELSPELAHDKTIPDDVLVYAIEGPFFFGAVESFERALAHTKTDPRALIIRLRRVPFVDITALQVLEEVIQKLHKRGVVVVLCEANPRVAVKLVKAGIPNPATRSCIIDDFNKALEFVAAISPVQEP